MRRPWDKLIKGTVTRTFGKDQKTYSSVVGVGDSRFNSFCWNYWMKRRVDIEHGKTLRAMSSADWESLVDETEQEFREMEIKEKVEETSVEAVSGKEYDQDDSATEITTLKDSVGPRPRPRPLSFGLSRVKNGMYLKRNAKRAAASPDDEDDAGAGTPSESKIRKL